MRRMGRGVVEHMAKALNPGAQGICSKQESALSLCIALLGFGLFFPCFWLKFPHVSENFKSVLWSWYVYSIHLGEGKATSPLYINTNALRGCT